MLMAIRETNYTMAEDADMQYDSHDEVMARNQEKLISGIKNIRFVLDNMLGE